MKHARVVFSIVVVFCIGACVVFLFLHHSRAGRDTFHLVEKDVGSIASALRSFDLEYGHIPFQSGAAKFVKSEDVIAMLSANTNNSCVSAENPKHIKFLDLPARRFVDGAFLDPWGNPYNIVVSERGERMLKVGGVDLNRKFAVWSSGKNGTNEFGNGDDVADWKVRVP